MPLLISADQLVDGRGGARVADAGVPVDAGMISWAGPMARAPQLPGGCRRVPHPGTVLPGFVDTHVHFAVPGGGVQVRKLLQEPPPVRALRIAAGTATAADVCGLGDRIGTLEPGERADLVVAAGDPPDDITPLADADHITLVVQDGSIVKHTVQPASDRVIS